MIGKLPRLKKGFTLPGYNYAGPYNPLDKQLKFDPNTGEIFEIYQQPSGKTAKLAMVHDVQYLLCGDKKCENEADRKMVKSLDSIPWRERQWGHAGIRNAIAAKQKLGLGIKKGTKKLEKAPRKENLNVENWQQSLANELHKPIRRKFTRRRVYVNGIDEIWAADLVEMGKFSKWNNGVRYLLMVIDIFSKFGWIEPLKNKKGETVVKAFKNILKTGRKPQNLWTDNGVEFYNKDFKKLLEEEGINLYSTQNEEKSSIVERWNRTIKNRLWKYFTVSNSPVYIDQLPVIVDKYNKSKHRSIKMTPEEASRKENEDSLFKFI